MKNKGFIPYFFYFQNLKSCLLTSIISVYLRKSVFSLFLKIHQILIKSCLLTSNISLNIRKYFFLKYFRYIVYIGTTDQNPQRPKLDQWQSKIPLAQNQKSSKNFKLNYIKIIKNLNKVLKRYP